MPYEIVEVSQEWQRQAVYRLRYDVYVNERGCRQKHADHQERTVCDPLDQLPTVKQTGTDGRNCLLGAFSPERVCLGTLRYSSLSQPIGDYVSWYRLHDLGLAGAPHSGIVTRFAVSRDQRNTRVALLLMVSVYRWALLCGAKYTLIDCNPPLRKFFERFGFRKVLPDFRHPEFGWVHPMILCLHDRPHMLSVASPFSRHLDELRDQIPLSSEERADCVSQFDERILKSKRARDRSRSAATRSITSNSEGVDA